MVKTFAFPFEPAGTVPKLFLPPSAIPLAAGCWTTISGLAGPAGRSSETLCSENMPLVVLFTLNPLIFTAAAGRVMFFDSGVWVAMLSLDGERISTSWDFAEPSRYVSLKAMVFPEGPPSLLNTALNLTVLESETSADSSCLITMPT